MSPQRRISSFASPSTCLCSTRKEIGWHPESKALSITFGLSAIKIPFSGSARFKSCISEILAYTSSSGALKSVISRCLTWLFFSCSVFLFSSCYCNRISLQKKARCYMFPPGFAATCIITCLYSDPHFHPPDHIPDHFIFTILIQDLMKKSAVNLHLLVF